MRNKDTHRTQFTGGHLYILKMLKELGISHSSEKEFSPYRVDVYLDRYHVAIEYDGAQHFRKQDLKRDERLMDMYSLPVLRMSEWRSKSELKDTILRFVSKWQESSERRKEALWQLQ